MRLSLSFDLRLTQSCLAILLLASGLAGCRAKRPAELETPVTAEGWFYQLQNLDHQELLRTKSTLLVIDPSRGGDGDSAGFWSTSELEALSGQGKIVLSYLSVGEAEDYRDYWQSSWNDSPPSFLQHPNPNYENNHLVKFWDPEWKKLMLRRLERDISAGFDGVYLDKVDAVEDWLEVDPALDPRMLRREMVKFVSELSAAGEKAAKKRDSEFVLYLQNGGDLWQESRLLGKIDGIALEEYSLGWENNDGARTPQEVQMEMTRSLKEARAAGLATLVVDYPDDSTSSGQRDGALLAARKLGARALLAPRELDGIEP